MTINNVLKDQDNSHYDSLVRNWEHRRDEEQKSHDNVERWRREIYAMRVESIRNMKMSEYLSHKLMDASKRSIRLQTDDQSSCSGSSFASDRDGSRRGSWSNIDQSVMSPNSSSMVSYATKSIVICCPRYSVSN